MNSYTVKMRGDDLIQWDTYFVVKLPLDFFCTFYPDIE